MGTVFAALVALCHDMASTELRGQVHDAGENIQTVGGAIENMNS